LAANAQNSLVDLSSSSQKDPYVGSKSRTDKTVTTVDLDKRGSKSQLSINS